jgi:hypothetical protein
LGWSDDQKKALFSAAEGIGTADVTEGRLVVETLDFPLLFKKMATFLAQLPNRRE